MPEALVTWKFSSHQSFRYFPQPGGHIQVFLQGEGKTPEEILASLPYERSRRRIVPNVGEDDAVNPAKEASISTLAAEPVTLPDAKRYRDSRKVFGDLGLLAETEDPQPRLIVTKLGHAVGRWINIINPQNRWILARHIALALAAVQLRNVAEGANQYSEEMAVFPLSFIWRAMLCLDGKISSDEMNRGIMRTRNRDDLEAVIAKIREARRLNSLDHIGPPVVVEENANDRIIPWIAMASFGWMLFSEKQKKAGGFWQLTEEAMPILQQACSMQYKHRQFKTKAEYALHISDCACLL